MLGGPSENDGRAPAAGSARQEAWVEDLAARGVAGWDSSGL